VDFNLAHVVLLVLLVIFVRWFGFGHWRRRKVEQQWRRGQEAFQRGDFDTAETAFRACVRAVPTLALLHRSLGGVLAQQGKHEEAEERLRFGAELEPRNPVGHMDLGFFLAVCVPGRAEEAIDAFATAIACDPAVRSKLHEEPRLDRLRGHERFAALLEPGGSTEPSDTGGAEDA